MINHKEIRNYAPFNVKGRRSRGWALMVGILTFSKKYIKIPTPLPLGLDIDRCINSDYN